MTKGLDKLLGNLNKEIRAIEGRTLAGVQAAALLVKGESIERTPVDTSFLRQSAFTDSVMTSRGPVARVGYTAKYAAWVHEMPMTLKGKPRSNFGRTSNRSSVGPVKSFAFGGGSGKGVYWQGGENKFLQKAISENHAQILQAIKKRAQIK